MTKIFYTIFIIFLLVFFSLLKSAETGTRPESLAVISFFDVGQGDAALIQSPFGQDILIDGGPDKNILEKLDQKMGMFNKDLELVFLTHNHSDHLDGLLEVLKNGYEAKTFVYSNEICQSDDCDEFFEIAKREIPEIIQARPGLRFDLFCNQLEGECYWLEVLGPLEKFRNDKNLNNASIILKARLPQGDFLFTGDAENEVWKYYFDLEENSVNLNADILKVPHHGSKTGICAELLNLTSPNEAIVSCGKDNNFGHPHPSALQLLDRAGIIIKRTDLEGDIEY